MNVATLYFSVWLIADLHASNTVYAVGNGISSILVVLSVPVLGAVSDARRRRKPWVVGFTIVSCLACAGIGILGQLTLPISGAETIGGTALPAGWHPTIVDLWLGARRVRDRQLRVSGRAAVLQRHASRSRAARGARPPLGDRHGSRLYRHDRRPSAGRPLLQWGPSTPRRPAGRRHRRCCTPSSLSRRMPAECRPSCRRQCSFCCSRFPSSSSAATIIRARSAFRSPGALRLPTSVTRSATRSVTRSARVHPRFVSLPGRDRHDRVVHGDLCGEGHGLPAR